MAIAKYENIANLLLALSVLFLLIGQFCYFKVESTHQQLIDKMMVAIDTEVKVIDIRETMNEALLRYLIATDSSMISRIEKLNSSNLGERFESDKLREYFNSNNNLLNYLNQEISLNDIRPEWEDRTWESLISTMKLEKNKVSAWQIGGYLFNSIGFFFLIGGIFFHWKIR